MDEIRKEPGIGQPREQPASSSVIFSEEINVLVHDPVRLGILILLMTNPQGLSFLMLQEHLNLTPGNLSSHTQKLAKADYVLIIKTFVDLKPRTFVKIKPKGITALKQYSEILEKILHSIGST